MNEDELRRDIRLMRDRDIWVAQLDVEQDVPRILRIVEVIAEIDREFDGDEL